MLANSTRLLQAFLCAALASVAPCSLAETAEQLLATMAGSAATLSYQGTFVHEYGPRTQSMRFTHVVIDDEPYELLEYLDGERRHIVRRGRKVDCVQPGQTRVHFLRPLESGSSPRVDARSLQQHYQLAMGSRSRVAGREVVELVVSPRDEHRFAHRLALDETTGLLLRSELLDSEGQVLERFQFVDIQLGEAIDSRYRQSAYYTEGMVSEPAEARGASVAAPLPERRWQIKWLPSGFSALRAQAHAIDSDMATFSDGLSVFSVFLEAEEEGFDASGALEGSANRGATIAYSKALILAGRPHRVTVVGEIPPGTAQQVAQSVALVSQ